MIATKRTDEGINITLLHWLGEGGGARGYEIQFSDDDNIFDYCFVRDKREGLRLLDKFYREEQEKIFDKKQIKCLTNRFLPLLKIM